MDSRRWKSLDSALMMLVVEILQYYLNGVGARNSSISTQRRAITIPGSSCGGTPFVYVSELDRCCRVCPPGSGVTRRCTRDSNSECCPCPNGSYSLTFDHEEGCHRCPVCSVNSHQVHGCSAEKPTKCECDPGYFYNFNLGICEKCSSCQHGYGAVLECSAGRDTACKACPNGTFSNVLSMDAPCQPCSICFGNEKEMKPCTNSSNRVCEGDPGDLCPYFWSFVLPAGGLAIAMGGLYEAASRIMSYTFKEKRRILNLQL